MDVRANLMRNLGRRAWAVVVLLSTTWVASALGHEIGGVQPYALDLPRVPAWLSDPEDGKRLTAEGDLFGMQLFAMDCFLDTGASRVLVCKTDRDALGIRATGATIEDWGIGGTETFDVSEPYVLHVGDSTIDYMRPEQYKFALPCTLQLARTTLDVAGALPEGLKGQLEQNLQGLGLGTDELLQGLMPAINVVGTPFLSEHVAILDPQPVVGALDMLGGLLGGAGLAPGTSGGSDPFANLDKLLEQAQRSGGAMGLGRIKVGIHSAEFEYGEPEIVVPLDMRRVDPEPMAATWAPVPFVEGAVLKVGDRQVRTDLLLDTGGTLSLISSDLARQLGLDLTKPDLTAMVAGVGTGPQTLKGFWLDSLTIATTRGGPLVYTRAPFFIADIEGLEGALGMNFLVPSVYMDMRKLSGMAEGGVQGMAGVFGLLADMRTGPMPFRRIVLDLPHGRLGLDPTPAPAAPARIKLVPGTK